eukprot:TRINITY_DN49350_c0_g1_i1.p1 TRINITY_DN49350_c0_g1~~TRINITY_DN49350_c0_g1_i1.p1  ORF type:complete len:168 (+),score=14.15 TRINITY_DN49350_c0_g1_i1:70-504(+)
MAVDRATLKAFLQQSFDADTNGRRLLKKVGSNGRGCTSGTQGLVRRVHAMPADLPEMPFPAEHIATLTDWHGEKSARSDSHSSTRSSLGSSGGFGRSTMMRSTSSPTLMFPRMDMNKTAMSPTVNRHFTFSYPESLFKPLATVG